MLWTFEITGVPLTGAIKVILTCDNVLVSFSDTFLQYDIGTSVTSYSVRIWATTPIEPYAEI